MKRRLYLLICSVLILAMFISGMALILSRSVMAQDDQEGETGNAKKGKYFFKEMCRHCHMPDSPYKELTPMSKTMDQWRRYFKNKFFTDHKNTIGREQDQKSLLEMVTPEILMDIKTFLIKHAADSDQPQTCG